MLDARPFGYIFVGSLFFLASYAPAYSCLTTHPDNMAIIDTKTIQGFNLGKNALPSNKIVSSPLTKRYETKIRNDTNQFSD